MERCDVLFCLIFVNFRSIIEFDGRKEDYSCNADKKWGMYRNLVNLKGGLGGRK